MKTIKYLLLGFLALIISSISHAVTISTGPTPDPGLTNNIFPFQSTKGDRYQQVYNSNLFSGTSIIDSITFFEGDSGTTFTMADYNLFLSTSNNPVNGLDTANLGNNVGGDNALFWAGSLSGLVGASFTFDGIDFTYDSSAGDLLLDISISNQNTSGTGSMLASSNWTNNVTSRAHDFGSGFTNHGLKTDFNVITIPDSVPSGGNTLLLLTAALAGMFTIRSRMSKRGSES